MPLQTDTAKPVCARSGQPPVADSIRVAARRSPMLEGFVEDGSALQARETVSGGGRAAAAASPPRHVRGARPVAPAARSPPPRRGVVRIF